MVTNSAAPRAGRVSSEHRREESREGNNRFNFTGFNGVGGSLPFQLLMLPQLQYNQTAGNHVCCSGNTSRYVTEVDSSKFLSVIVGQ